MKLRGSLGRVLVAGTAFAALLLAPLTGTPTGTEAVGNPTLRVEGLDRTVNPGDTFTLRIMQDVDVETSGAQVDIGFDRTLVKILDVAPGSPYATADFAVGIAPQTEAQAIAEANTTTGVLENASAFYSGVPPITAGPDAGTAEFLVIQMQALSLVGVSPITITNPVLLDNGGNEMTINTITNGAVTVDNPTLRFYNATRSVNANDTFTIRVWHDSLGASTGGEVDINFDQTKLEIMSLTTGTHYPSGNLTAGVAPQTVAQAIASANTTGTLLNAATYVTPPTVIPGKGVKLDPGRFLVLTMHAKPATSGLAQLTLSGGSLIDAYGEIVDVTVKLGTIGIGPDPDGDGAAETADNCPAVSNPTQTDTDADTLGDACEASHYGTDPADNDTDNDGCHDGREARIGTFAPIQGGERDPLNGWDLYDVNGSRKVDAVDIGQVRAKFNTTPGNPLYNANFDRGPGVNAWAPSGQNGVINAVDVGLVRAEFNHSCL